MMNIDSGVYTPSLLRRMIPLAAYVVSTKKQSPFPLSAIPLPPDKKRNKLKKLHIATYTAPFSSQHENNFRTIRF